MALLHFDDSLPIKLFVQLGDLESIVCNRFIKPQHLYSKNVHQLSLRGPNVLFLARVAYGDGSTHIKRGSKK